MPSLGYTVGHAALTFTVTNIDALCLLILFFAKVKIEDIYTNVNVCIAQVIGFSVIVGISLLGGLLSAAIEPKYISLLGVVPIAVSLKSMYTDWNWAHMKQTVINCIRSNRTAQQTDSTDVEETVPDKPPLGRELSRATAATSFRSSADTELMPGTPSSPNSVGIVFSDEDQEDQEDEEEAVAHTDNERGVKAEEDEDTQVPREWTVKAALKRYLPAQIVENAIITVSNGGDNVAIYIATFASIDTQAIVITVVVYYVLLICWLCVSFSLVGYDKVTVLLIEYGHYLVPLCLIATGVYILSNSVLVEL